MSEFEDKLHAILSDPAEMERIGRLASELMGGGAGSVPTDDGGGDGTLLRRLGGLLGGAGLGDKAELVNALSPYLRPDRRERLHRALRLAGVLRLAGTALREEGGAGGV